MAWHRVSVWRRKISYCSVSSDIFREQDQIWSWPPASPPWSSVSSCTSFFKTATTSSVSSLDIYQGFLDYEIFSWQTLSITTLQCTDTCNPSLIRNTLTQLYFEHCSLWTVDTIGEANFCLISLCWWDCIYCDQLTVLGGCSCGGQWLWSHCTLLVWTEQGVAFSS